MTMATYNSIKSTDAKTDLEWECKNAHVIFFVSRNLDLHYNCPRGKIKNDANVWNMSPLANSIHSHMHYCHAVLSVLLASDSEKLLATVELSAVPQKVWKSCTKPWTVQFSAPPEFVPPVRCGSALNFHLIASFPPHSLSLKLFFLRRIELESPANSIFPSSE